MSLHEIEIEYGERYTDFVMGMYVETRMADDIDELGWNLCDCDNAVFQEKIGHCKVAKTSISKGELKVKVILYGVNEEVENNICERLLNSWEDLLFHFRVGYLSRT